MLQLAGSEIPTPSRAFFGGLQHWIGLEPPSVQSIAGTRVLHSGVLHIRAILETGGAILGARPLDEDGIVLPTLLSSRGGAGVRLLLGANAIRPASREEWGTLPVLTFWGYDFIFKMAEQLAGGDSKSAQSGS